MYLEHYSLDAPELRKAVSDACDWMLELLTSEVEDLVQIMKKETERQGRASIRLREGINTRLNAIHGVQWSS